MILKKPLILILFSFLHLSCMELTTTETSFIYCLPTDMLSEIAAHSDIRTIANFKETCKSFNEKISHKRIALILRGESVSQGVSWLEVFDNYLAKKINCNETALIYAIKTNNTKIVTLLIEAMYPEGIGIKNSNEPTALLYYVKHGYAEIRDLLIKEANIYIKENRVERPTRIFTIAKEYYTKKEKELITEMSVEKLNCQDNNGKTALFYAIYNKDISNDKKTTPIKPKSPETAKLLINKMNLEGLQIKDNNNQTALMYAIEHTNTEIAKLLNEKTAKLIKITHRTLIKKYYPYAIGLITIPLLYSLFLYSKNLFLNSYSLHLT